MQDIYALHDRSTYNYLHLKLFLDSPDLAGLLIWPMDGLAASDESRAQPKPPKIGPKLAKPTIFTASGPCRAPHRAAYAEQMAQLDVPHA